MQICPFLQDAVRPAKNTKRADGDPPRTSLGTERGRATRGQRRALTGEPRKRECRAARATSTAAPAAHTQSRAMAGQRGPPGRRTISSPHGPDRGKTRSGTAPPVLRHRAHVTCRGWGAPALPVPGGPPSPLPTPPDPEIGAPADMPDPLAVPSPHARKDQPGAALAHAGRRRAASKTDGQAPGGAPAASGSAACRYPPRTPSSPSQVPPGKNAELVALS